VGKNIVRMQLVHGNRVVAVGRKDVGKIIDNCDGLITNSPEIYLALSAADCLPIALFDPITNSIGFIHAGWRGLEKGVIRNSINLMVEKFKVNSEKLIVYIGPFICQKHYEVKSDVSGKFFAYPTALRNINGKTFLDLGKVAKEQLVESGINKNNIWFDGRCTFEDKNLFSYRRGDIKDRINYLLKIPDSP